MTENDKKGESLWVGLAGAVVSVISILVLGYILVFSKGPTFGQVAALILVGFAAFVVLMNVLSYAAYVLDISNKTQPFGLPEGSVRAVLTLSLIVLVGVLASFLITRDNRSIAQQNVLQRNVDRKAANDFVSTHPTLVTSIKVVESSDQPKTADGKPETDPQKRFYDVVLNVTSDDKLAEDISKQILTMLSTILAAMIGFYFGAKSDGTVPPLARRGSPGEQSPSGPILETIDALQDRLRVLTKGLPAADQDKRNDANKIKNDLDRIRSEVSKAAADTSPGADAKRKEAGAALDAIEGRLKGLEGPAVEK